MSKSKVFSNKQQLVKISEILSGYLLLPYSNDTVPGSLMESVISNVHEGEVLNTYDFVDVINHKKKVGWQVKSTKATTPVTWKRAKIPNSNELINDSMKSEEGLQALGDSIIRFCNEHAAKSFDVYGLDEIGFARLILRSNGTITYYERQLCTKENPKIFHESEFEWRWSTPKVTRKKEQLKALHGFHKPSNTKWFAWHGLGENQLHFSGEKQWWPTNSENTIDFNFPKDRMSLDELMILLENVSSS